MQKLAAKLVMATGGQLSRLGPAARDGAVIKGDPSKNINEIENVETVFKAGIGYDSK